jgi:hypothetical protein
MEDKKSPPFLVLFCCWIQELGSGIREVKKIRIRDKRLGSATLLNLNACVGRGAARSLRLRGEHALHPLQLRLLQQGGDRLPHTRG